MRPRILTAQWWRVWFHCLTRAHRMCSMDVDMGWICWCRDCGYPKPEGNNDINSILDDLDNESPDSHHR